MKVVSLVCQLIFLLTITSVYSSACSCSCRTDDGPQNCKDIHIPSLAEVGVKYLTDKAAEGLTASGPKPGSLFAKLMSYTSKQNGGSIPKESFIGKLQSMGNQGWKDMSPKLKSKYDVSGDVAEIAKVLECCRCSCGRDEL